MPTRGGWLCTIASTKHDANHSKNTGEDNHFSFVEKDSTTKGAIRSSGGSCCIHLQRFSWHYHRPPEKCLIPSAELSALVPCVFTPVPTNGSDRDSDMFCLLPVPLLAVLLPKENGSVLPPDHPTTLTNPAYSCAFYTRFRSRRVLASVCSHSHSALCSWDSSVLSHELA